MARVYMWHTEHGTRQRFCMLIRQLTADVIQTAVKIAKDIPYYPLAIFSQLIGFWSIKFLVKRQTQTMRHIIIIH